MIGVAISAPNCPGLVIVNVPPWTSSGLERSLARAGRELADRCRHALEREPLGLADHRHDEPVVERDRDPEVDVVVEDDRVVLDSKR